MNTWIQEQLHEIGVRRKERVRQGAEDSIALAEVLAGSVFDKKPELYFLLTVTQPPSDDHALYYRLIGALRENNVLNAIQAGTEGNPETKEDVSALKEDYEKEFERSQATYVDALSTIYKLESDLRSQKEECSALQRQLEELADLEVPEQPLVPSGDFMYMSLCQVYMDDRGQSRLERLMDVADGRLSDGFSPDAPEYFRLYQKDGPNEEGAIGIWDWKTVPNKRDISRDYIVTAYHASAQPIEVIVCRDCPTVAELLDRLKRGIAGIFHSDRILFAVDTGDLLEGIYCDRINSTFYAGKVTLASEQIKLPVYAIERGAILRVRDLSFLSRTGLGIPRRLMQAKDPIGLVREIVLRRATWPVLQQRGFLRKEYQKMKDFLSGLPTADLYDEIRQACDCTEKEAEGYLAALISRSDASISGATMENDVMAQIIRNDPRAYRESLDVLRQDWEKENRDAKQEAEKALSKLREEEADCAERVKERKREYDQLGDRIAEAENRIQSQKQLADEVEGYVKDKIGQARKNAAEFIAENAFIYPADPSWMGTPEKVQGPGEDRTRERNAFFSEECELKTEDPDSYDDPEQLLQTIQYELLEAGASEALAADLAALLYSAYINRIPLLLAGPNGREIASAFVASLRCAKPAVLSCEGPFDRVVLSACEKAEGDTVVIEDFFQPEWKEKIVRLISRRDKMYFLIHPFAEDLTIEPRGLFHYCVPVLTEQFIVSAPSGDLVGGRSTENYVPYTSEGGERRYGKLLDAMRVRSLARENVQQIIADMHTLTRKEEADPDHILVLYPLAYVLGETTRWAEYLDTDEKKIGASTREMFSRMIGEG